MNYLNHKSCHKFENKKMYNGVYFPRNDQRYDFNKLYTLLTYFQ